MDNLAKTWVGATAKQISRAVRRGDTTATQVVADHLEQIAITDPSLAAFRVVRAGEAIAEAEKVDDQEDLANLPLAGVPVAVKENTPVAGLPTWFGSAAVRTAVAEEDHEVVRRLRGAGAVVVGVTRMPEMGLWATTDGACASTAYRIAWPSQSVAKAATRESSAFSTATPSGSTTSTCVRSTFRRWSLSNTSYSPSDSAPPRSVTTPTAQRS